MRLELTPVPIIDGSRASMNHVLRQLEKFTMPYIVKKRHDKFWNDVIFPFIKRRHKLKITQMELNDRIGVADKLVSKWECGMRRPNVYNLYNWAEALKCKITLKVK